MVDLIVERRLLKQRLSDLVGILNARV